MKQNDVAITEIMTKDPVCIHKDESVNTACEILENKKFRHLPVVDQEGIIIGILSDRDARNIKVAVEMVDSIFDFETGMRKNLTIEEVMSKSPSCITATSSIADACQLIIETKVGALPVVTDVNSKKLVGIVSYVDLLQWYLKN